MNKNANITIDRPNGWTITSWFLGAFVFIIGLANLVLVHPVPGLVFIAVALSYLPTTNSLLLKRFGFKIPVAVKIVLALMIFWFTLGVSDLGNMIDKL